MTNDVTVTHQHADEERAMQHVEDERVDGVRLRQYACDCGYTAAVLTRLEQERVGASWPFEFRSPTPPMS